MPEHGKKKVAARAARTCRPRLSQVDKPAELVASQVQFGLTYAREAREAYQRGELAYGELAQSIAMNAYAAALRFAGELCQSISPELLDQIEALELDLIGIIQPLKTDSRFIA